MGKSINRKTASSKSKKSSNSSFSKLKEKQLRIIFGVAIGLFAIFLFCVMTGFLFSGGIDQSIVDVSIGEIITNPQIDAENPGGWFGAGLANLLINHWFGLPSFILCYLLFICSLRLSGGKVKNLGKKFWRQTEKSIYRRQNDILHIQK